MASLRRIQGRLAAHRVVTVIAAVVLVLLLVIGLVVVVLPSNGASGATVVTVSASDCASEWTSGHTGTQTFEVENTSDQVDEINLDNASGAVVAEIETLAPATTVDMVATLGSGYYQFVCLASDLTMDGLPVHVTGPKVPGPLAVQPVSLSDLLGPNSLYQTYAGGELTVLAQQVQDLRAAIVSNDLLAAEAAWLTAQMTWERVGASYDSFGDEGAAVDGLPDGLPGGVNDPDFTGLHRIEYGLYHGQTPAELLPVVDQLQTDVATIEAKLMTDDEAGDPTNLPLRVHEILEDALRDHLSGIDDEGSGMAYAETYADSQVTQTLLSYVAALINTREPGLVSTISERLDTLQAALVATDSDGQWQPSSTVPLAARQRVDAAIGAALTSLSDVPGLLEVPANGSPE